MCSGQRGQGWIQTAVSIPGLFVYALWKNCNRVIKSFLFHFFIVNYLHKREVIRDQAEYYLNSQCRNYEFFGEYRAQWELIFDDVDIDLHPDVDSDDIALTMAWEKMDCFVDALALELAISNRAESNIYLLYDDKEVFEKVLEMLNEIMQQENLNRYDKT